MKIIDRRPIGKIFLMHILKSIDYGIAAGACVYGSVLVLLTFVKLARECSEPLGSLLLFCIGLVLTLAAGVIIALIATIPARYLSYKIEDFVESSERKIPIVRNTDDSLIALTEPGSYVLDENEMVEGYVDGGYQDMDLYGTAVTSDGVLVSITGSAGYKIITNNIIEAYKIPGTHKCKRASRMIELIVLACIPTIMSRKNCYDLIFVDDLSREIFDEAHPLIKEQLFYNLSNLKISRLELIIKRRVADKSSAGIIEKKVRRCSQCSAPFDEGDLKCEYCGTIFVLTVQNR